MLSFRIGSVMAAVSGLGTDPPAFNPGSATDVVAYLMLYHL
jgi:hypothetical protein